MRRILTVLLILGAALGSLHAAAAVEPASGEPNFAKGWISQGEVDDVEFFYTDNVKSQDGFARIEDDFNTLPPAAGPHPYSWRLQEWNPSSNGCGCFVTIAITSGVVADGQRHPQCYEFGVESGGVYRVKYTSYNNFPYSFTGHWWFWGYNHNC